MKVLYIGGTGNISWWCVKKTLEKGHECYVLNRAETVYTRRAIPLEAKHIVCDIRNVEEVSQILRDNHFYFDVICDFICYNRQQALERVKMFSNCCTQYIFISSESVYSDRTGRKVLSEEAAFFGEEVATGYIKGKIEAERVFQTEERSFELTIIRPCEVYDNIIITPIGKNDYTIAKMLQDGYPLLVFGDGENSRIPLHSSDFADAFAQVVGNESTYGQDYLIVADNTITVNEMMDNLFQSLRVNSKKIYIPEDEIDKISLIEDKLLAKVATGNYNFSNAKIKLIATGWQQKISYEKGIQACIKWINEDSRRVRINTTFYDEVVKLIKRYQ